MSPDPTHLNKIVEEIIGQDATTTSYPIMRMLEQNLDPIDVDQKTFETVLRNLILNACDAMPSGGEVHIKTENITHTHLDA